MKRNLFSRRTCGSLLLLGVCAVVLFRVSANYRKQPPIRSTKPSICSHMEYNKSKGVNGSISSTAQLPLRELLAEKSTLTASAAHPLGACGCNAGTSEEYLYWHSPQGNGECLFEREKVLVCKSCGTLRKRYPAEQLLHKSGDDSLPGICPEQ